MPTKKITAAIMTPEDIAVRDEAFQKMEEIAAESKNIEVAKVSDEILKWVIANVESFIDNHKKMFKLDLILDESVQEIMPESMKIQRLYQAIPADEVFIPKALEDSESRVLLKNKDVKAGFAKIKKCKTALDAVTKNILKDMRTHQEQLATLFKRMAYYYEVVGFRNGEALEKVLEGAVDIVDFEYENFSMTVSINDPEAMHSDTERGSLTDEKIEKKSYVLPAAFTIWLEISYKENNSMMSLF